jgi:hypothetical protein
MKNGDVFRILPQQLIYKEYQVRTWAVGFQRPEGREPSYTSFSHLVRYSYSPSRDSKRLQSNCSSTSDCDSAQRAIHRSGVLAASESLALYVG